jgi:hypothetical protein
MRMGHTPVRKARLERYKYHPKPVRRFGGLQCIFALTLSAVRMDGSRRHSQVVEEVVEIVDTSLGVTENHCPRWWHRKKKIVGGLLLVVLVTPENLFASECVTMMRKNRYLPAA